MAFKEIKAEELTWNPFTQIGKGWFLVTAGDEKASNTMTVSWGGLGVWWGKDAATIYIRQNRCTKEFIDAKETFTISSLPEAIRKSWDIWAPTRVTMVTSGKHAVSIPIPWTAPAA